MEEWIKKSDAIKAVNRAKAEGMTECPTYYLGTVPSADRPQGEWTNAGMLTVHCSNCKSEFHELEAMNFCPNCGCRMKGADDE